MPTQATNAVGQTQRHVYDSNNRLVEKTDPFNRTLKRQYDANGNIAQNIDALNRVTHFTYEPKWNKPASITRFLNGAPITMQFAYHNTLAKLISTTDPLGNSRTQSYTPDGQLATITVPGGNTGARTSTLEYNAAGDPVKAIDPLGNETLRQTDGITRVTRTE